ncbi:MAG TPA: FkbM family methyltransferase [Candidatus Eisenbacteria bacterium]|jgi:FkbM family methyltransferase
MPTSFFRRLLEPLRRAYRWLQSTPGVVTYLGGHRALVRTGYGRHLFVDTRDLSVAPQLLLHGNWEPGVTRTVRKLLRPSMTVIEVGANVGYYSMLAAWLVERTGRVYSFEANPHLARLLRQGAEINGFSDRLTVIEKAAWSSTGTVDFHLLEEHMGSSSASTAIDRTAQSFHDRTEKITVDAVALDGAFPAGTRVDLLKIDAEGAEGHVLRGGHRLLQENPEVRVVMEFYPSNFPDPGEAGEVLDQLTSLGFQWGKIEVDHPRGRMKAVSRGELMATTHAELLLWRGGGGPWPRS